MTSASEAAHAGAARVDDMVNRLPAIGLADLNEHAALQDRIDVKYIVTLAELTTLIERVAPGYSALEIGGRRSFGYRTTYYDTDDMLLVREHVQQRRRRFKCRKRHYLDSDSSVFEVKLKGARGRTIKHAMACGLADEMQPDEIAFLHEHLRRAYERELEVALHPSLVVACRRMTIVSPHLGERLTIDRDVDFGPGRLDERLAIVESKSARGGAAVDRALLAMGVRPVKGCSKYLLGMSLTREGVRDNNLRPLLRRYFAAGSGPDSAAAVEDGCSTTWTSTRVTSRT